MTLKFSTEMHIYPEGQWNLHGFDFTKEGESKCPCKPECTEMKADGVVLRRAWDHKELALVTVAELSNFVQMALQAGSERDGDALTDYMDDMKLSLMHMGLTYNDNTKRVEIS